MGGGLAWVLLVELHLLVELATVQHQFIDAFVGRLRDRPDLCECECAFAVVHIPGRVADQQGAFAALLFGLDRPGFDLLLFTGLDVCALLDRQRGADLCPHGPTRIEQFLLAVVALRNGPIRANLSALGVQAGIDAGNRLLRMAVKVHERNKKRQQHASEQTHRTTWLQVSHFPPYD